MPYKTLLLSVRETAAYVVREMLDKYALTREDPSNYCLVQVTGSPPNQQQTGSNNNSGGSGEPPSEYILEDDECPLSILMNHTPGTGNIDPYCVSVVGSSSIDFGSRQFNCFFLLCRLGGCMLEFVRSVRCYG